MRMRNLLLWTAAAAWMASCDPALAATYRLDLDWKTLAFTNRPALGELATVEVLNIGESDPTNLTLYLSNRGGSMLAITEGMNAISNGATAGLALNTTNLLAEFDSIPPQGSKSFDLSIWDSSRSILLASAPIDVRNNPLWETLSFTNLPAIESLGLSEYLSRANDWTSATATARYTLDLGWKDLTFDNSMAVAERAVVEIRGIGDAEPTALMLWLSNPQMEGLAVTPMMAASGTNGTAAVGMLNLATTNLLAEFDGRRPDAERRFDLSIWDTQRDVLLGSAAVHIRNNPLARHFVEGWTNVPSAIESQFLASITEVQSNLTAHATDTDNPHGVTAEQLGALTAEEDAAALAAIAGVSVRVDTVASNTQPAITSAVYVVGASGEVTQWGSDAANAIRSMSENDTVHVSEGDFQLGTNQYIIPRGASIAGAGMYKTRFTSEIGSIHPDAKVQCLFLCTSNNTFSDFSASAPAVTTNSFASIFGDHSEYFTGTEIRRVYAFSRSDSLFMGHSGTNGVGYSRRLTATDSHFESEFDAAVIRPAGEYVFENCTFKSLGPNEYLGPKREAGIIIGGSSMPGQYDVRLQDCTIIARDGQNGVFGIGIYATGATVRIESTFLDVSGTGQVWQVHDALGSTYISGGNVEPNKVYGNATIREMNTAYEVVVKHAVMSEVDPSFSASIAASIVSDDLVDWNAAFGWGNHRDENYIKSGSSVSSLTSRYFTSDTLYVTNNAIFRGTNNLRFLRVRHNFTNVVFNSERSGPVPDPAPIYFQLNGINHMGITQTDGVWVSSMRVGTNGIVSYPATATNSYIRPDGGTNTIYFDAASNMVIAVDGSPSITISPSGNVGLNVDEPEAQLDVGGNVLVRSNLLVRSGKIQLGDGDGDVGNSGTIIVWNGAWGRYDEFGQLAENSFAFGAEDGPKYGFSMDGEFGGEVDSPWYNISEWNQGVVFKNAPYDSEVTNRASIKVSLNPPGFIFNVNGVIWTNTP